MGKGHNMNKAVAAGTITSFVLLVVGTILYIGYANGSDVATADAPTARNGKNHVKFPKVDIEGENIDDILVGGPRKDKINGAYGNDIIYPDEGADTILITSLGNSQIMLGDDNKVDKIYVGTNLHGDIVIDGFKGDLLVLPDCRYALDEAGNLLRR